MIIVDYVLLYCELLNPIEHIWEILDRRVRDREAVPVSLNELRSVLKEKWENIKQYDICSVIDSMNGRLETVIVANGGNGKY